MAITISNKEDWEKLLIAAEKGSCELKLDVALQYENGIEIDGVEIVKKDDFEDFRWTKSAYENGNVDALVRYADYLSMGKNCEKNLNLATQLYKKGVALGISIAAFNLGIEHRNKQDFKGAFKCY